MAAVPPSSSVIKYFEGTRWDYRYLWRSRKAGALHFGYYDQRTVGHVQAVRRMTDELADAAGISAADRVVDAGCGLGGCAIRLATVRQCQISALNITPFQVREARDAVAAAGLEHRVQVLERDFGATELPSESHTVVWALESVVHAEDKQAFLRESFRLLRPGGRLVIAEYLLRDDPEITPVEARDLETWCSGWSMPRLLTDREYRVALEEEGFDVTEIRDISRNVAPSLRRLGHLVRFFTPTVPAFERLRMLDTVPAANFAASAAQIRAFDTAAWSYKVVVARKPDSVGWPAQ